MPNDSVLRSIYEALYRNWVWNDLHATRQTKKKLFLAKCRNFTEYSQTSTSVKRYKILLIFRYNYNSRKMCRPNGLILFLVSFVNISRSQLMRHVWMEKQSKKPIFLVLTFVQIQCRNSFTVGECRGKRNSIQYTDIKWYIIGKIQIAISNQKFFCRSLIVFDPHFCYALQNDDMRHLPLLLFIQVSLFLEFIIFTKQILVAILEYVFRSNVASLIRASASFFAVLYSLEIIGVSTAPPVNKLVTRRCSCIKIPSRHICHTDAWISW